MKYLPLLLLLASCAAGPTELIRYKAVRCDCQPDISIGYRTVKCDTGHVVVPVRNIIKRDARYIKVFDGYCTFIYAL